MDRFAELSTFVAVAERGGFAAASRHLGISAPAVTRLIAALEQRLGITVFRRSTRSVVLTEEGAALLERAREILAQLQEAERVATGGLSAPRGELHITAPVMFGRLHVLPVVEEMLAAHKDLSVRLMLLDRNIRLIEEGIDVAVRVGEPRDSNLRSVAVGMVRQVLVASPRYCAEHGCPTTPQELVDHDIIAGENIRTGTNWRFGPKSHVTVVKPRLIVTSIDAQIEAAAANLGIANVLSYQVAERLVAGKLCSVLDAYAPPPLPIHLLFDSRRARLPSVRLFIDCMRLRERSGAWS